MDHQSVVAIVGQSARMAMGGSFQQEVDLNSLYKDVAKEFVHTVMIPEQMQQMVDRAIRIAKAERTVTCIIIPNDVQELDAATPPRKHNATHTGVGFPNVHFVPGEADLRRTANLLNEGKKIAMLVGAGALHAGDEIMEVAELLGAGVAKALLGKAAVPVLDSGCCGMAGYFGYLKGDKYDVSVKAGERVLLPAVRGVDKKTLVISNGYSCREQIEQMTDREGMHIAQVLQMALDENGRDGSEATNYPEKKYIDGMQLYSAGLTVKRAVVALSVIGLVAFGCLLISKKKKNK